MALLPSPAAQAIYMHLRQAIPMRALLFLLLLFSGCSLLSTGSMKLEAAVEPSTIELTKPEPAMLRATVTNVGDGMLSVRVDVVGSEGLRVTPLSRTGFRLKPGEERTVRFRLSLTEDALPGVYRIDVIASAGSENVTARAKLRVKGSG